MARILVVDDDEQIRIMLDITLTRDSHEVVTAQNGVVAAIRQSERPADIVIMDIIMDEDHRHFRRRKARPRSLPQNGQDNGCPLHL